MKNTDLPHVTGNFLTYPKADSNPGPIVLSVIGAVPICALSISQPLETKTRSKLLRTSVCLPWPCQQ